VKAGALFPIVTLVLISVYGAADALLFTLLKTNVNKLRRMIGSKRKIATLPYFLDKVNFVIYVIILNYLQFIFILH